MAIVQNTYTENIGNYRNGQIINTLTCDAGSVVVDETDGIEFGRACHVVLVGEERRLRLGVTSRVVGIAADFGAGPFTQGERRQFTAAVATITNAFEYDGATADTAAAIGDLFERRGTGWVKLVPLPEYFIPEDFEGVTVKDVTRDARDEDSYKDGAVAAVLFRGDVAIEVASAVALNGNVTVNVDTGELSDDAPAHNRAYLPRAQWVQGAEADANAHLRLGR